MFLLINLPHIPFFYCNCLIVYLSCFLSFPHWPLGLGIWLWWKWKVPLKCWSIWHLTWSTVLASIALFLLVLLWVLPELLLAPQLLDAAQTAVLTFPRGWSSKGAPHHDHVLGLDSIKIMLLSLIALCDFNFCWVKPVINGLKVKKVVQTTEKMEFLFCHQYLPRFMQQGLKN